MKFPKIMEFNENYDDMCRDLKDGITEKLVYIAAENCWRKEVKNYYKIFRHKKISNRGAVRWWKIHKDAWVEVIPF